MSILNKIRNNSTASSNQLSKKSSNSSKSSKTIDIFNDGLNKSDSDSESDSDENDLKITEDDLRIEFEKSINMNKNLSDNKLPE